MSSCGGAEAMAFAGELAIPLLPKVGYAWMPHGTQLEVMMPGQNERHYVAGGLDLTPRTRLHGLRPRQTKALFRDLLGRLEASYPAERYMRLYVVVDNYKIPRSVSEKVA